MSRSLSSDSAARYAWVLDLWGRHDEAEAVLATLMNHQDDEGLLSWNFGLTDTGTLLIARISSTASRPDEPSAN